MTRDGQTDSKMSNDSMIAYKMTRDDALDSKPDGIMAITITQDRAHMTNVSYQPKTCNHELESELYMTLLLQDTPTVRTTVIEHPSIDMAKCKP